MFAAGIESINLELYASALDVVVYQIVYKTSSAADLIIRIVIYCSIKMRILALAKYSQVGSSDCFKIDR